MMETENKIKLNDFYQAVLLKTLGFPLLYLERGTGRFVEFVFSDPDSKAQETLRKYWDREIRCVARDLIENINELKTRVHSGI